MGLAGVSETAGSRHRTAACLCRAWGTCWLGHVQAARHALTPLNLRLNRSEPLVDRLGQRFLPGRALMGYVVLPVEDVNVGHEHKFWPICSAELRRSSALGRVAGSRASPEQRQ